MNKIPLEILSISHASNSIPEIDEKKLFLLLFKEIDAERIMPIFITEHEARNILIAIKNISFSRPTIYETLNNILSTNNIHIREVLILQKKVESFYAQVRVNFYGEEQIYDSITSDAIIIALHAKAPIFVDEEILDSVKDRVIVRHTDNAPVEILYDDEIDDMLRRAIDNEDYERASLLRDEKLRRQKPTSQNSQT